MYLIFDVSAVSKPKDWKAPFSDTFSWPRMVHLSWILIDKKFKLQEDYDFIVESSTLYPKKIQNYCKIDKDDIDKKSEPLIDILNAFNKSLEGAKYVISFNLAFNENVLAAEYIREGLNPNIFQHERICLMQESTFYCKIPNSRGGYKWPTLTQLHAVLFQKVFTPPNNARADVIAATRSFIMMMKIGQLQDAFDEEE